MHLLPFPQHRTAGVAGFGYNADDGDTPSPVTTGGNGDSVDPEDSWWVAAASGAAVGLGVLMFAAILFNNTGTKKSAGAGAGGAPAAVRPSVMGSSSKRRDGFVDETKAEPF